MNPKDISYSHDKPTNRGGQHVGTMSAGVRATHVPIGKTVFVNSERSQHANQLLAVERLVQLVEGTPPVVTAVETLSTWMRMANDAPSHVVDSICLLIDHARQLEQALSLLASSMTSVTSRLPAKSLHEVGTEWR